MRCDIKRSEREVADNRFEFSEWDSGRILFDANGYGEYLLRFHEPAVIKFNGDVCIKYSINERDIEDLEPFIIDRAEEEKDAYGEEELEEYNTDVGLSYSEFRLAQLMQKKISQLNMLLNAIENNREYLTLSRSANLGECESWREWAELILRPGYPYKFRFEVSGDITIPIHWDIEIYEDRLPDYKSLLEGKVVVNH